MIRNIAQFFPPLTLNPKFPLSCSESLQPFGQDVYPRLYPILGLSPWMPASAIVLLDLVILEPGRQAFFEVVDRIRVWSKTWTDSWATCHLASVKSLLIKESLGKNTVR